jgi:hypothetical protein
MGCILICDVKASSASLIAVLLDKILEAAGIAGCCDESIT